MSEKLIGLLITVITAIITAIITYTVNMRVNSKNKQMDLLKEQKFKYFLPFKYYCNEFLHRLLHIENKLTIKDTEMINQLKVNYSDKNLDWYFLDWTKNKNDELIPSGYYLTSTIYMNCILYFRIKQLQTEYPFLIVKLKQKFTETIKDETEQIKRCYDFVFADEHIKKWNEINDLVNLKGKIPVKRLIEGIRVSTIVKNGIPYTLHDSFGDFITDNKDIINYEKFCKLFLDDTSRTKFLPLINFWSTFSDEKNNLNDTKLNKIRLLIIVLTLIQQVEMD